MIFLVIVTVARSRVSNRSEEQHSVVGLTSSFSTPQENYSVHDDITEIIIERIVEVIIERLANSRRL